MQLLRTGVPHYLGSVVGRHCRIRGHPVDRDRNLHGDPEVQVRTMTEYIHRGKRYLILETIFRDGWITLKLLNPETENVIYVSV